VRFPVDRCSRRGNRVCRGSELGWRGSPVGKGENLGGESRQLLGLGLLAGSEDPDLLSHGCDDLVCLLE